MSAPPGRDASCVRPMPHPESPLSEVGLAFELPPDPASLPGGGGGGGGGGGTVEVPPSGGLGGPLTVISSLVPAGSSPSLVSSRFTALPAAKSVIGPP